MWRSAKSAIYPLFAEMPKNVDAAPRRYSRGRWRVAAGATRGAQLPASAFPQGGRWQLAEQGAIIGREPPKAAEPVVPSDRRDTPASSRFPRIYAGTRSGSLSDDQLCLEWWLTMPLVVLAKSMLIRSVCSPPVLTIYSLISAEPLRIL